MKTISVVIPAYNEKESLPELYNRIKAVVTENGWTYEIIFIDDGSRDGTFDAIQALRGKDENVRCIRFRSNAGKAAALDAGFKKSEGEYVITMDADLQDDPNEIPELINKLKQGYDLVSGWKKKRHDPLGKRLPSKLFNLVTSIVSGVRLHDFNCGLKAYRSDVVKSIRLYGDMHRYVPAIAHWKGFRVTEKVVLHHARKHGKSKYGVARLFTGYLDLLTVAFLNTYMKRPLHLFGLLGMAFVLAGSGILGYFGYGWLITGEMRIRPLVLLAVTSVILGIQFISIGLLGEMVTYSGRHEEDSSAIEI